MMRSTCLEIILFLIFTRSRSVLPTTLQLSFVAHNSEMQNVKSKTYYAYENSSALFTCESIGSQPAAELSWRLGDDGVVPGFNNSEHRNSLDGGLFDIKSTIRIRPKRKHHKKFLFCYASLEGVIKRIAATLLMVYGPPDGIVVITPEDLHDDIETNVSCTAVNGFPAPHIHWYIGSSTGSRNLTENSSRTVSLNADGRYDVESTLRLLSKRSDNGKRLVCQAVQLKTPSLQHVTASVVLNISYEPFVFISSRRLMSKNQLTGLVLTCTSDANPPAFTLYWLCNEEKLNEETHNVTLRGTMQKRETFTYTDMVIGIPLLRDPCQYKCVAESRYGSARAYFNSTSFSFNPDPPFDFVVDRNQTTSSAFFVAWQPEFNSLREIPAPENGVKTFLSKHKSVLSNTKL